ncbi:MAG TPA: SUMF1/EgtB/PvdO family nonheme iron enzyme [Terracidiphilus sp.]|jgi:iron(II)-dependent oxidoreductase|nr:SUMF1/EgtB/PvdO family nonheme iron enzyme [Terracidiphilus sp.]
MKFLFGCRRIASLCLVAWATIACAQDTQIQPRWEQIPGPSCASIPEWNSHGQPAACSNYQVSEWLEDINHWRAERRIRAGYNDELYRDPALLWTQSSFVQPQMMIHDRKFYDPAARKYTVDRYLDDVNQRYGGIDSVLIWHTYSNIGIDNRSQYDLFQDLPGGKEAVKQMVDDFHRHQVRVLFPIMLWDQGTHDTGLSDADAISKELAAVGADGINGDTLEGMPRNFHEASVAAGHPLALEPETGLASDEMLDYNNLTWGYWEYTFVPSVSRYKWLETRHMVNLSNRWAHNHTDDLQEAFFNGIGFESWENIWGIWNQLTPRDAEALRRIATIERAYAPLLISSGWRPHVLTQQFGVFASLWPGDSQQLWTIVNRNGYSTSGRQLRVPYKANARYFDLWHGVEIHPEHEDGDSVLEFAMEPLGFGAILEASATDAHLEGLMQTMRTLSQRPLAQFSSEWHSLPQQMVPIVETKHAVTAPSGMVNVPAADYVFRVNGIEIEGMNDDGVDVQYPWEDSARRYHEQKMHIKSFWIDKFPVTNADFKRFLDATHYRPADDHNFLKDWKNGTFPEGWRNKPVTWVALEDARAYAQWAGKRLPHEWEWQYAAQGTDNRTYPWGNQWPIPPANATEGLLASLPSKDYAPYPDKGRDMKAASDVDAHPTGASPFGVMDMVGNVWQWTDEYVDEHTRAGILRGGSHYEPQGSRWYFPQAYKLSQHGKYLLMAPSIDRSGTVGFRCVVDGE